jgi:hypothetical protein
MLLLKAESLTSTKQLPLQSEWRETILAHLDMLDPKQLLEKQDQYHYIEKKIRMD